MEVNAGAPLFDTITLYLRPVIFILGGSTRDQVLRYFLWLHFASPFLVTFNATGGLNQVGREMRLGYEGRAVLDHTWASQFMAVCRVLGSIFRSRDHQCRLGGPPKGE